MKLGCPRAYPLLDVVIQSRSDDSIELRVRTRRQPQPIPAVKRRQHDTFAARTNCYRRQENQREEANEAKCSFL